MMRPTLSVTDRVLWRGGFGDRAPVEAQVSNIEICQDGKKYGRHVPEVDWAFVLDPLHQLRIVVNLTNGHWAYGYQLSPLSTMAEGGA